MSPMAGGEGSLTRGAAKIAAAAGPQGPLKRYPSKRNARKEAAASGPHGSSKRSTKRKAATDPASGQMPRPRASGSAAGRKSKEGVKAVTGGERKNRMPQEDIDWILNWKPRVPPARYSDLKRSNPELTPRPGEEADEEKMRLYCLAKAFYDMVDALPSKQAWLRAEVQRKGYVELDDETIRRRAEVQEVIDREWPEIEAMIKDLVVDEKEYRRSQGCADVSDSDDEGEGGGDETESDSDEGEDGGESDFD